MSGDRDVELDVLFAVLWIINSEGRVLAQFVTTS